MKIKYKREAELLEHYDKNVNYFSPINGNMDKILSLFGIKLNRKSRVLDVGCGTGYAVQYIKNTFDCSVIGVDYSIKRITEARRRDSFDSEGALFVCDDINNYLNACEDNIFDLIMIFETLEHLVDPPGVLEQCKRTLKPGGLIIGSVPINMPYMAHLQVYHGVKDVKSRLGARDVKLIAHKYAFFKCEK